MQPESVKMFAAEVLEEMNNQKLNYNSFSKRCKVTPQYINRVLSGKASLGLNIALKMAEGLGMKVILCLGDK